MANSSGSEHEVTPPPHHAASSSQLASQQQQLLQAAKQQQAAKQAAASSHQPTEPKDSRVPDTHHLVEAQAIIQPSIQQVRGVKYYYFILEQSVKFFFQTSATGRGKVCRSLVVQKSSFKFPSNFWYNIQQHFFAVFNLV